MTWAGGESSTRQHTGMGEAVPCPRLAAAAATLVPLPQGAPQPIVDSTGVRLDRRGAYAASRSGCGLRAAQLRTALGWTV